MDVFNEIPESLTGESSESLTDLRARLRDAGLALAERAQNGERLSAEEMENARTARRVVSEIDAELATRQAEQDEAAEIAAALSDEGTEDEDGGEGESTDEALSDDSEYGGDEDGEDEAEDEDEGTEVVTAAATPARRPARPRASDLATDAPATPDPITPERVPEVFRASAGVNGMAAGDPFQSMDHLSKALVNRWRDIRGGGTEKIAVATISGRFTDEQVMTPGDLMPATPESLQAGLGCVPRQPLYDVGCASSEARPVANSLGNRRAPRGGYSQYPSPRLADVTDEVTNGAASGSGDGTGIWTRDDDDDPDAVKAACSVIPCGTPQDWDIYGVYRCITIKNLHAMAHPELVAAFLNKLGSLWARLAERSLLDAMATPRDSYTTVTNDLTGEAPLSAFTRVLDAFLHIVGLWREQERYDSIELDVWLHRWVQVLLARDWLRRNNTNLTRPADLVIGMTEISAALRDAGVNVHWTLDAATDWEEVATQGDGVLEYFPTQVDMVLTPAGNFQRLDEGSMTVGVTNRTPWDLDDMRRNQFTMFWESYEGLLDLGCPSWGFSLGPLCPTGLQHAGLASGTATVTCDANGGSGF